MKSHPKDKAKGSWVALLSPSGPHQAKAKGPDRHLEGSRSPVTSGGEDDDDDGGDDVTEKG